MLLLEHFIDSFKKKAVKLLVFSTKEKYKNLVAYSAINKFLRTNKILAPKLYAHNYHKGIIIIEDFGDSSFYKELIKEKKQICRFIKNL